MKFNHSKFIIIGVLITLFSLNRVYAQEGLIPDDVERQALVDLYQNTNGDLWWDNTGWLSEDPVDTWFGVTKYNGDIVKLDLSFNDLEGEIPESLYNLTALEELWLEYNYLEGPIGDNLGDLENLNYLGLRFNYFEGQIPNTIGNLQNLIFLDLFENNLSGTIPDGLYTLTQLEELYLAINSLQGSLSSDISNLINLRVLQLEDNLLSGKVPSSIGNCTSLEDLFLGYNLFEGELPVTLNQLHNLLVLDIIGTPFSGELPQLSPSANLYGLYLSETNISSLGNLKNHPNIDQLVILYIDGMKLEFKDIQPLFDSEDNPIVPYFYYSPQDSINTYFNSGNVSFSVDVEGIGNEYQWFKNGTAISGEIGQDLILGSTYDANASYYCEITNSTVPDLTLFSKKKAFKEGEFYAVKDGNWKDTIWAREKDGEVCGEIPDVGSKVFIIGKNVIVNDTQESGPIEVIVENQAASLTVSGVDLTIYGNLTLKKITKGFQGNVKVIDGGKIIPTN